MADLKNRLTAEIVSFDEIKQRQRGSDLEDEIRALVAQLEAAETAARKEPVYKKPVLAVTGINYGHFDGKISQMRHDKKIDPAIRVMKRKDKFYLIRK